MNRDKDTSNPHMTPRHWALLETARGQWLGLARTLVTQEAPYHRPEHRDRREARRAA